MCSDSSFASGEWWKIYDEKIPTILCYDENHSSSLIAWGEKCQRYPLHTAKEHFKAFIGDTNFEEIARTFPGGPSSQRELHGWVKDYLIEFCTHVIDTIKTRMKTVITADVKWTWNFTIPEIWQRGNGSPKRDFKRLAINAVTSLLPMAHVDLDCQMTEGEASAHFLLASGIASGREEYQIANTVISCDIGGATTDIAVATIGATGRPNVWKSDCIPIGTVAIEDAFLSHATETLQGAGVENADQLALQLVKSNASSSQRMNFGKGNGPEEIKISQSHGSSTQTPESNSQHAVNRNNSLYIPRYSSSLNTVSFPANLSVGPLLKRSLRRS